MTESRSGEVADELLGIEEKEELKLETADPTGNEIRKLPDEMLAQVVSRLPLKEAINTSLVSTKWKDLWKQAELELDFDDEWLALEEPLRRPERFKKLVDRVVEMLRKQHNGALRKFGLRVSDSGDMRKDVGRWLEFAISKRVESLHFGFRGNPATVFPECCYNHIKTPAGLSEIKSLRSLHLDGIELRGEVLDHIVANCPLLEELVLENSVWRRRLKFVGSPDSPLSLKNLEITKGHYESLEIDHAPRLVQVICYLPRSPLRELHIENCQSLVKMQLDTPCRFYSVATRPLSGGAGHLKSLDISIDFMHIPLQVVEEHTLLERLTVKVTGYGIDSILGLVPLINLCPRLHTLNLLFVMTRRLLRSANPPPRLDTNLVTKTSRESIKAVEIVFFDGCKMHREFVRYAMEYFVGLERMVIYPLPTIDRKMDENAEEVVLRLKAEAPSRVEFVIINFEWWLEIGYQIVEREWKSLRSARNSTLYINV